MNQSTFLIKNKNTFTRFSINKNETPLKRENLDFFPIKNLYPQSFSILFFNNDHQYKNNKDIPSLENRITTIDRIQSEFQSFLNLDNTANINSELKRFSQQIFNEYLTIEKKAYNTIELLHIADKHFYIIEEAFKLYEKFKGESIPSFIYSNLLQSNNLIENYKSILCLSNFHDDNNIIALKIYHLVFCQDTPLFSFSQENIYPIGIDDDLNTNFIKSHNKELKEVYFKNKKLLKFINDPNSLCFDRALKHSFSYSSEKDSDIYFLHIWHQFLNEFKAFPSQEQVISKEYQSLFFSLRDSIFQLEKKYSYIKFSQVQTNIHDVYSCDLIVDIKNKNNFQYNFQAEETIANIKDYIKDYPSWFTFQFSYYEKTRKLGIAQKLSIPMKEGTLDVLFNQKYKKDYFYLTAIQLLLNSKIETIEISDYFLNILTKYPEQTEFIIEKHNYILNKLQTFQPSDTIVFYFNLIQHKLNHINENQNYYELDNLFNHLISHNKFSMFLTMMFNFSHENNSIITCLLKNSFSLNWIQNNFLQMLNIISNDNFNLQLEHKTYFIHNAYKHEDFKKLLTFFKDSYNTQNKSDKNIRSPLLELIIKNYENEFLNELRNDMNLLNISIAPLFKTSVNSEFYYVFFKIFQKNIDFFINKNSQNSLKIKCLTFTRCLSNFKKDDFLFIQNLLDNEDSIINIKNFYFKGLQNNVWNDDEIISILSKKYAYLLRNNDSFLLSLAKNNSNEKILKHLTYLITPIPNQDLEYKIFNSSEFYISFLTLIKRFDLNNENTPILHDYINSFLASPNFNSELKKYLNNSLTIENYKQLESSEIEDVIEKSIMKQENQVNISLSNKNQTVRKF